MVVYLDCNATTPIEPEAAHEVMRFMLEEFGNSGSRTHAFGQRAKGAVQQARRCVAALAQCRADEVIFTSGATESNNLAILGLAPEGRRRERRHIISSVIEHKAVLEPLARMEADGFEVTYLRPTPGGWIEPSDVIAHLRPDTLLISLMHVNNETGIIQPIEEVIAQLGEHPAYLHIDAAQSFGKILAPLQLPRIDLISISGHKMYGPKGIGALIARRRDLTGPPPLTPLMVGGGQERGLRPGTLPVPQIAGLGKAAELAFAQHAVRRTRCEAFRDEMMTALAPAGSDLGRRQHTPISYNCLPALPSGRCGGPHRPAQTLDCHLQWLCLHFPRIHPEPRPVGHGAQS